jgi:type II secretory pathway pseudopilin PulG
MNTLPTRLKGYTLVETLVAISILMIAIVIPFYSVQKALQASNIARDSLIASSLAEEAMEYIYYVRDNNFFYYNTNGSYPSGGWLAGLSSCVSSNGCTVDPTQNTVSACSGACPALKLNTSNLYTYTSGTDSRFTRTVKIQTINAHESRVTVTVTGNTSHNSYTSTVTENIYSWL